jgi:hypothetical protein
MQVFISYQRKEEAFARRLREYLQAWGYSVWLDVEDIPRIGYWDNAIDESLKTSDVVVGIVTPEAVDPKIGINVQNEWAWAQDNKRPFLLLLRGEIPQEAMPHRYKRLLWIDFTKSEEEGLTQLKKDLDSLSEKNNRNYFSRLSESNSPFAVVRAVFLGNEKAQHSQLLLFQNIFDLLGIQQATDSEKTLFLDELQDVLWEDCVENDVEALLTEDDFRQFQTISQDREQMVNFLEERIVDFGKIMFAKALEFKQELTQERISEYLDFYKDEPDKLEQINKAQSLLHEHRWRDVRAVLNSLIEVAQSP